MTLGRQNELLAQLRELLLLPSPTTTSPPVLKVESGGPLGAAPNNSCDQGTRRRRGRKKRARDEDDKLNGGEHDEEPAAQPHLLHSCNTRRKKQQVKSTSLLTSVPDFDGYQWRKYGQKQIEGAMYPRSYYRCIQSAEQGCQAKRTVQRNDDGGGATAAPEYTVVYMGEHTCTANDDSLEAPPVILDTTATATAVPDTTTASSTINSIAPPTSAAGSCCSTTITAVGAGIESPAISEDMITWSSSSDYVDDFYCELWSSSSLQETMEDFAGPIRSPVHMAAAADGWTTMDHQFLLHLDLANEPALCHFSF